jgi:hypothetical protein
MSKLALPTRKSLRIDDVSSSVTYIGEASFGSSEASAVWRIFKLSLSGTVTSITWADGNDEFDNVWDDRLTLSYT